MQDLSSKWTSGEFYWKADNDKKRIWERGERSSGYYGRVRSRGSLGYKEFHLVIRRYG